MIWVLVTQHCLYFTGWRSTEHFCCIVCTHTHSVRVRCTYPHHGWRSDTWTWSCASWTKQITAAEGVVFTQCTGPTQERNPIQLPALFLTSHCFPAFSLTWKHLLLTHSWEIYKTRLTNGTYAGPWDDICVGSNQWDSRFHECFKGSSHMLGLILLVPQTLTSNSATEIIWILKSDLPTLNVVPEPSPSFIKSESSQPWHGQ